MRSHKTIRRGLSVALAIVLLFATFSPVLATEFSDDADYISDGFGASDILGDNHPEGRVLQPIERMREEQQICRLDG